MSIKRDPRTEFDVRQMLKVADIKFKICQRYSSCYECPLSRLGVFETQTCDEIDKLESRLELAYKVVETL